MRLYPHDIDEDVLEEHFFVKQVHYKTRASKAAMAQAQRDVEFFNNRHTEARQLAALAYALEEDVELIHAWLNRACEHASTALHLGNAPSCFVHMTHLAVAVLSDRNALRQQLEDTAPSRRESTPELFLHTANAFRHLSADQDDSVRACVSQSRAWIEANATSSDAIEVMEPYLQIMSATLDENAEQLERAMRLAHDELARNFNDSMGVDCDGLIDFVGLGMLQLATQRGLQPPAVSTYLPSELLRGL